MNGNIAPDRMLRAVLAATSAFCAVYLLQSGLQFTSWVYDPIARASSFGQAPVGVQMRYFGDVAGASVAFALTLLGCLVLPARRPPDVLALAGSCFALLALDLAFFFSRVLAAS